MLRAPKADPTWAERERIFGALLEGAAGAPAVMRAQERAALALDTFLDADGDQVAAAMLVVLRRLRSTIRAYVTAQPLLKEFAYPAARISTEDQLVPPQLTYFVAPLASLGILGQSVLRQLLLGRDGSWVVTEVLQRLDREVSFTTAVLHHPRPLPELQRAVSLPRSRGRPAGRSRPTKGWVELPDTLEALVALIRPVVDAQRRNGDEVNVTTVATRLGFDERRLREAFAHHGVRGAVLLRQVRREQEDRR